LVAVGLLEQTAPIQYLMMSLPQAGAAVVVKPAQAAAMQELVVVLVVADVETVELTDQGLTDRVMLARQATHQATLTLVAVVVLHMRAMQAPQDRQGLAAMVGKE
jgi:hypothetical protein